MILKMKTRKHQTICNRLSIAAIGKILCNFLFIRQYQCSIFTVANQAAVWPCCQFMKQTKYYREPYTIIKEKWKTPECLTERIFFSRENKFDKTDDIKLSVFVCRIYRTMGNLSFISLLPNYDTLCFVMKPNKTFQF